MEEGKVQEIKGSFKQDITNALKKKRKPAAEKATDPEVPHGKRVRWINRIMIFGAATASCLLVAGLSMSIWTLTHLDQFISKGTSAAAVAMPDGPRMENLRDFYTSKNVLEMKPSERQEVFREIVHFERTERETHVAKQIDEQGIVLKSTKNAGDGTLRALIQIDGGEEQAYKVGDEINGMRVLGINMNRVFLMMNGKKIILSAKDAQNPGSSPETKVDIVFDHEETAESLSPQDSRNMEKFIGEGDLTAIPSRGFKVSSLERSDPLSIAGLKEGDIILSINGIPLVSHWAAMQAYRSIGDQSVIPVDYERAGKGMSVQVSLR